MIQIIVLDGCSASTKFAMGLQLDTIRIEAYAFICRRMNAFCAISISMQKLISFLPFYMKYNDINDGKPIIFIWAKLNCMLWLNPHISLNGNNFIKKQLLVFVFLPFMPYKLRFILAKLENKL